MTITNTITRQSGASKPRFRLSGQGTMQRPNTTIDNTKRLIAIKTYDLITSYPILYKAGPGAILDILIRSNVINKNYNDDIIDIIVQAFKKYKSENNYKQANVTFDTTDVGRRLMQGENIVKITKGALKKVIREEIENLNELYEADDEKKPGLEVSDEQQLGAVQSKTAAKMAGSEDNPIKYMKMSSLLADKPTSERGEGLAIWAMDLANNDIKLAYSLLDKAKMELAQFKKQV